MTAQKPPSPPSPPPVPRPTARRPGLRVVVAMLATMAILVVTRLTLVRALMAHATAHLLTTEGPGGARRARWSLRALAVLSPWDPAVKYLQAISATLLGNDAACRDALIRMAALQSDASGYCLGALARVAEGDALPAPGDLPGAGVSPREPLMLGMVALGRGARTLAERCLAVGAQGEGHDYLYHLLAGLDDVARGERGKARAELRRAARLRDTGGPELGLGIESPIFQLSSDHHSITLPPSPWTGRFVTARRMAQRTIVDVLYALAFLDRDAGAHARSMSWADLALKRHGHEAADCGLDHALDQLAYPVDYGPPLAAAAAMHGVDPLLVLAIVREESHFDPAAVSHAGAQGLMQLMPRTGQWVAQRLGRPDVSDASLLGPSSNLDLGCAYVAYLQGEIGASPQALPWVLAAYNGGLTNAHRWMSRGLPPGQAIDFPETRDYVERVQSAYRNYARLYKGRGDLLGAPPAGSAPSAPPRAGTGTRADAGVTMVIVPEQTVPPPPARAASSSPSPPAAGSPAPPASAHLSGAGVKMAGSGR